MKALIVSLAKRRETSMSGAIIGVYISLLSVPGKVHGRGLTERLGRATEGKANEEQRVARQRRGYIYQIYSINMTVESHLRKSRKL